jgi:hypothetical protein
MFVNFGLRGRFLQAQPPSWRAAPPVSRTPIQAGDCVEVHADGTSVRLDQYKMLSAAWMANQ